MNFKSVTEQRGRKVSFGSDNVIPMKNSEERKRYFIMLLLDKMITK